MSKLLPSSTYDTVITYSCAVKFFSRNQSFGLKGTYQGFSFFIANSFYISDFMYLLGTQIIFHNVQ